MAFCTSSWALSLSQLAAWGATGNEAPAARGELWRDDRQGGIHPPRIQFLRTVPHLGNVTSFCCWNGRGRGSCFPGFYPPLRKDCCLTPILAHWRCTWGGFNTQVSLIWIYFNFQMAATDVNGCFLAGYYLILDHVLPYFWTIVDCYKTSQLIYEELIPIGSQGPRTCVFNLFKQGWTAASRAVTTQGHESGVGCGDRHWQVSITLMSPSWVFPFGSCTFFFKIFKLQIRKKQTVVDFYENMVFKIALVKASCVTPCWWISRKTNYTNIGIIKQEPKALQFASNKGIFIIFERLKLTICD